MLQRPDALRLIDAAFATDPVVLTLGGTIREMLGVAGRKPNHFYSLDAMGQTVALGLGLAAGLEPSKHAKVAVVEGDGSLLMGFSVLPTVGHVKPRKLVAIVLDNGVYLATGGQPTAAHSVDFVAAALACGWAAAREVESTDEAVTAELRWARAAEGPILLRIRVGTQQPKTDYFLEDPVVLARDFRDWVRSRG